MKMLPLLLCFAALLSAQTPTDSQLLLNEVRQLRQDLAATSAALQRTQILLFRLQLEDSAIARAAQRLDQAKSQFTGVQQRRKNQESEIQGLELELQRTQDQTQKARIPQMIAGLKREIENYAPVEQDAQSKLIDAENQFRSEQAKHDALEAALEKIDKQLESSGRK
jgi:chromosome segregation ATPase